MTKPYSSHVKQQYWHFCLSGVAEVDVTQLKLINSDHNKIYVVKTFDTLQDIAGELIIDVFKSVESLGK